MDSFLDKAKGFLNDIAGEAGRQAETVQLQTKLGSLEDDLDQVYIEAGKRAEELLKARQIYDDELRVILERGRAINEEMMEIREQIQQLRQKPEPEATPEPPGEPAADTSQQQAERTCPACGEPVAEDAVFCAKCGKKLE